MGDEAVLAKVRIDIGKIGGIEAAVHRGVPLGQQDVGEARQLFVPRLFVKREACSGTSAGQRQ